MTFETHEDSRTLGEPVSLYLFRYGDSPESYFAYTDAEQPITHLDIVYEPISIDRGNIISSGTLDKATVALRTPVNVGLAQLFTVFPPSRQVSVAIRQGHVNDPGADYLVCWVGRVLSCTRENHEVIYNCEPISTSMRRPALRRHYQYGCPHALYGPDCKANQAAATSPTTVVSIDGNVVVLASDWAAPEVAQKYIGGMLGWTNAGGDVQLRMILSVDGATLTLGGLPVGLVAGQAANVVLGCNHGGLLTDDCIVLHDNILNYGGCLWIPSNNPLGVVNRFY